MRDIVKDKMNCEDKMRHAEPKWARKYQWTTMTNSEPVRHNESQQVTLSHKSHNEPQNEPQKAIMSNNGT